MTKTKMDHRVTLAKALYDQSLTFSEIGDRLQIPESTVRSWNYRYWNPPKPWPKETIAEAKKMYREGKRAVDIAYVLGIPDSTIRRWASIYGWGKDTNLRKEAISNPEIQRLESIMIRIEKSLESVRNSIENYIK